jgi:hypothetical protein
MSSGKKRSQSWRTWSTAHPTRDHRSPPASPPPPPPCTHTSSQDRVTGGLFSQYTLRAECNRRRHIFARGKPHSLVVWGYHRPPPPSRGL